MLIKHAIAGQYRATLVMLLHGAERCPDDLWESGGPHRPFWRIAYHAALYTHLYLMPTENDFKAWEKHTDNAASFWGGDTGLVVSYPKLDLMNYIQSIIDNVETWLQSIDLEADTAGFN